MTAVREGPHRRAAFLYVMASSYKVDIGGLLAGGRQRLVVDQQVELEPFESVTFPEPARTHLEMQSTGDVLEIGGSIAAQYRAECDRCLADVVRNIEIDVDERLDVGTDALKDPFGPSNVIVGERLDIKDLATQLVCSAIPLTITCAESCKGLCPNCGENKNTGACACEESGDA